MNFQNWELSSGSHSIARELLGSKQSKIPVTNMDKKENFTIKNEHDFLQPG